MSRVRIGYRHPRVVILFSSGFVLGLLVLIWFNLSTTLSDEEAATRVRTFLSREVSQKYMPLVMNREGKQPDVDRARQMAKELRRIKELQFVSIDVARLIPDFVLRPHMPTHIVRVVLRDRERQYAPRYFWLPWGGVDTETSRYAWYFSL